MAVNSNQNAMELGVSVLDWTPEPLKYLNDNIHPSVLFIDGGFAGHEWWMATTPYPNFDVLKENPILYYGDSEAGGTPPLSWSGGVVVEDTPATGYNSDPCLYFDGVGLWIFWRANNTPDTNASGRATMGVYTTDGVNFTNRKVFNYSTFNLAGKTGDDELCPIIKNFDGNINLYGTYYEFTPTRQPYGLALWNIAGNDLVNNGFVRSKTIGQLYKKDFNFWHFDLFKHESKYYCVVTPEQGTEILLGVSDDGENFEFWDTPLLSNSVAGTLYLYKPTAMVKDGVFYVWHPNRVNGVNEIWMSQKPFNELLDTLNNTVSKIK